MARKRKDRSTSPPTQRKRRRSRSSSRNEPNSHSGPLHSSDSNFYVPKGDSINLPAAEDWRFRIEVIASATDLTNGVFQKAVQGLVKICFPETFIEEVGLKVITSHMRALAAPEKNVEKMGEVFWEEVIGRLACTIATLLDTPEKLEKGLKDIVTTSARLHHGKDQREASESVLSDIEELVRRHCSHLISQMELGSGEVIPQHSEGDEGMSSSDCVSKTYKRPKKRGKRNKQIDKPSLSNAKINAPCPEVDVDDPKPDKIKSSAKEKENKVSTSWRWDVQLTAMDESNIATYFKRATDLFAFQMLPLIRIKEPALAKKAIRQKIETKWLELSNESREKWNSALQELRNGDLGVLKRVPTSEQLEQFSQATFVPTRSKADLKKFASPAKLDGFSKSADSGLSIASKESHDVSCGQNNSSLPASKDPADSVNIKDELNPNSQIAPNPFHNHVDPREGQLTASAAAPYNIAPNQDLMRESRVETPIVDLLWGGQELDHQSQPFAIQTIMNNLNNRIPSEIVNIPRFNGHTIIQTKVELQAELLKPSFHSRKKLEFELEKKMIPWVIENIRYFPELSRDPFVFIHMLPYCTSVLSLVCESYHSAVHTNASLVPNIIMSALEERGILSQREISIGHRSSALRNRLEALLRDQHHSGDTKRCLIERLLRQVALDHRDRFPELRSSDLVREWERRTRQMW